MIGPMGGQEGSMPTFSRSVDVDRPIAEVWDVWTDVRLLPRLSKSTVEVRDAPERLTAVGQTFCQVVRAVKRSFEATWTVTSIRALDHLTIEGSVGFGVTQRLTEQVEDLGGGRTRLTIRVDYELPFGPLGRVAAKLGVEQLAQRESSEVLDQLKVVIESLPTPVT
jgi:uncharacterized membrane protein